MSASNGGGKGKKFRPPAKGKDDDDDNGNAALLARCDKGSEKTRRDLEEARRQPGPVRTRSRARMELGTTAGEKPRGKRYGTLLSAYFSVTSFVNPVSGKFTQPVIPIFKLRKTVRIF